MYDPLIDAHPTKEKESTQPYWAKAVCAETNAIDRYPAVAEDIEVEIAIIGAGFTGLSAAYHLSKQTNTQCCVIDAVQPGWGCSGRNGGFVLPGTGRLSLQDISNKWDHETSLRVFQEYNESIDTAQSFIDQGIECSQVSGGYLRLAHTPSFTKKLHDQAEMLNGTYGENAIALSQQLVNDDYIKGPKQFGGIFYPDAFGINPWLLCTGIAKLVSESGTLVFGDSPIVNTYFDGKNHQIRSNGKIIRAKTVIIATNGYGAKNLFPILRDKLFPVISSIIVTEPLTASQLASLGMRKGLMVMDTRSLKYYYRLLPDNRLLFGGRGAVMGKNSNNAQYQDKLYNGLLNTFPFLSSVSVEHFWSGWVAVSADSYPRIHYDQKMNCLYSAGYCGAGLAFSLQAGKRLAQMLCSPDSLPDLPYWKSPLKSFPLPQLRRPALRAFYAYEEIKAKFGL